MDRGRGDGAAATSCGRRRRIVRLRLMSMLGELGRARPAVGAVRAHSAVEPRVLLAQEDGKPDHARHGGHRSAVGVHRVRRRGRVAVAGDADRARRRAAHARLAARPRDDAAGAGVLLADLPARRVAATGCSSATWRKWSRVTDVLSDTIPGIRVVKAFNQEAREIERFDERNDDVTDEFNRIHQHVDDVLAAADVRRARDDGARVGARGAAVVRQRRSRCRRVCSCRSCCTRRCSSRRSR